MLIISRFRSAQSSMCLRLMFVVLAVLFTGLASMRLFAADDEDDEPAVPPPPGRVAEEVDIFKQRAREIARKEKQETKTKKRRRRHRQRSETSST